VKVTQAYRFALEPTPAQERALRSHAGAARFAWNWGLARCQERYDAEGKWHQPLTCTGCGTRRRRRTRRWPGGARTASALTRRHSVTYRDVNAARNLLKLAASGAESINACGAAVRPGPAGHAASKQEPGTAHADQTGTASRQQEAAA
jgi:transposase